MAEVKQQLKTIIVAGEDYDLGVLVLRVPREVVESPEGKMVVAAILGKDSHYNPYTRMASEENVEHIAAIDKILEDWKLKYAMKLHSADGDVVLGSMFV